MVARNHCLMRLRDKTGRMMKEITDDLEGPETALGFDDRSAHLEKDLKLEVMEEALNDLNEAQRRCVVLFYLDKKSYQAISDITGYSILNIKSHIQNGKRNLKLAIEKKLKQK